VVVVAPSPGPVFGVGVVIFAERAAAKVRSVVWLSLWRFGLLLVWRCATYRAVQPLRRRPSTS